jgi:hypothetical protein
MLVLYLRLGMTLPWLLLEQGDGGSASKNLPGSQQLMLPLVQRCFAAGAVQHVAASMAGSLAASNTAQATQPYINKQEPKALTNLAPGRGLTIKSDSVDRLHYPVQPAILQKRSPMLCLLDLSQPDSNSECATDVDSRQAMLEFAMTMCKLQV